MSQRIRRVFLNVSMGNRHDGLARVATAAGVKLAEMKHDDYLVFINTGRDKIAMLVGPQALDNPQPMAYVRLGKGRTVDFNAIRYLPKFFNGTSLSYDGALKEALEEHFKKAARAKPHVIAV